VGEACPDGQPTYRVDVFLNAAKTSELNESLARYPSGNTLVWDTINEVPVASDPNVLSFFTSDRANLAKSQYSFTLYVQFANY